MFLRVEMIDGTYLRVEGRVMSDLRALASPPPFEWGETQIRPERLLARNFTFHVYVVTLAY